MSQLDLTQIAATSIATPGTNVCSSFVDSVHKTLKVKDDSGFVTGSANNFSTTAQTPTAATRTYITGTKLAVTKNKLQVGTMFRWKFNMTKTAAGIASSTIDVAIGTAGTTADTARLSFVKPAGTAVADEGWVDVICTVRSIGASGVMVGEFIMYHNLAATGHALIPVVVVNTISAGFDMTVADLFVGLCITTGASDVITIQMAQGEVLNL